VVQLGFIRVLRALGRYALDKHLFCAFLVASEFTI